MRDIWTNPRVNVEKLAAKDAYDWAIAEYFFGPGAGTRRKLLGAQIDEKMNIGGYIEAFDEAYARLNFGEIAAKAAKERQAIDRAAAVKRNTRGLLTGNRKSLSTTVLVVGVAYYYAHETGLDKEIAAEVKMRYTKTKRWVDRKIREHKGTQMRGM